MEFDLAAIQAAGYETQTPVIVTNPTDFQVDPLMDSNAVMEDQAIMRVTQF
ncbi:hypothetical protein NRIC_28930 [Enterococcus florum]|uniref:Uncharacterized protein n=1 Tax=Enterococcus florum TaxID=2480627 RepID=A0A4P5PH69_9ENTE|nr:hypothetical protein NRIC_28930 [Enterococcus florum]